MAIAYMEKVTIDKYDQRIDNNGFEYSEEMTVPGSGKAVIIPDCVKNINVTIVITSGSGKVQATTDSVETVLSESGVTWVDWDAGVVDFTVQDSCSPVTALRMVNVSSTVKILVRAQ